MSLIAVDMTPALPGGENGGAKVLAVELLKSFQTMAPKDQFLLLTASWNHDELAALDSQNMSRLCVLKGEKPSPKPLNSRYPGRFRRGLRRIFWELKGRFQTYDLRGMPLRSRGVDLLFCPFTAPTYAEPGVPLVSVVYDLQHRDLPQFFSPHEIGLRNAFLNKVSQQADQITCISEHVRQAVLKHLKTNPKRTHTIHVSVQSRLSTPDQKSIEAYRSALGIGPHPYMFYPANFWPHKNHHMLLTAYGMFLSRNPQANIDLVFTGALDDLQKELKEAVRHMGLSERVHFLGFLPQEKLEAVWYGCEFLIFPSLYEGFGIPVLEAMSIGKPVLCSNCTSLPEVAADAALYFDPRKPADIVQCLETILRDPSLRADLVGRGYRRAAQFRPEAMTCRYLELFDSLTKSSEPLSEGVTGVFEDGWVGDQMFVAYSPGPKNRTLELKLEAPPWLPSGRVKLKLQDGQKTLQKLGIRRGKEVTIRQHIPEDQGCLTLSVTPTFTPSEYDMGEDNRVLGIRCHGCWVLTHDQERRSLLGDSRE